MDENDNGVMEVISKEGTKSEKLGGNEDEKCSIDSASALQSYFNSIPISSFPNLMNSHVMEVQANDLVRDAIQKLYQKNASVALITDPSAVKPDTNVVSNAMLSDRYIGIISFASMVLWCIQELRAVDPYHIKVDPKNKSLDGFFSRLDQDPRIKQSKVADLAKLFLWDPFFPVHLEEDTFFHVLLLLSKHRLQVVPVIERPKSRVIGLISQNAVMKMLLQSEGLEWFDIIANSALSEFRFETKDSACQVYGDQSVSEALSVLSEKRVAAVAVIHRNTRELLGTVRETDISLLLDNAALFKDIKKTTLKEFIKMNSNEYNDDNPINSENEDPLRIKTKSISRMDSPVFHNETDILKKVMAKMTETNSKTSFLVDATRCVVGMITLRDIIVEFAPPCVDSTFDGGGFFESVLQQSGCRVDHGTVVCD
ncbi:hypothetical protein RND81_09G173500 [Saponaria officinalis]|uniref:CBS domain-containing protein n=2 Tax=Saponaria officinalis TaxID=3572 RepID=A0AAW1IML8_SAPOF